MDNIKLTKEESKLLKDFEAGKFESVVSKALLKEMAFAAKNTLNKKKNMNIRVSQRDLFKIRSKAHSNGVPYQTLVSTILHKYANDDLSISL